MGSEMPQLPSGMTGFDVAVILVFMVAGAWGYGKGLVHFVLYVGSWVGAVLAMSYGYSYAQPYAHDLIRVPIIADVLTAGVLFFGTLIGLMFLTRALAQKIQGSALGGFDKLLGFAFGILAATVLFSLAYLGLNFVMPKKEQPEWLAEARTMPLIARASDVLVSVAPKDFSFAEFGTKEKPH